MKIEKNLKIDGDFWELTPRTPKPQRMREMSERTGGSGASTVQGNDFERV